MKSRLRILSLFIGGVFALAGMCMPGQEALAGQTIPGAQSQYLGEFEEIKGPSQEEFKSNTQLIEQTPYENSEVSFRVRLPESWEDHGKAIPSFGEDSSISYGSLAKFSQPPSFGQPAFLEISAFSLKNATSAFHWMHNYAISSGYSIEKIAPLEWKSVKLSYTTFQDGWSYKVLSKGIIDRNRIYVASFYLPIDKVEESGAFQARVIESFKLTTTNMPMEPVKKYELFNICNFEFYRSWSVKVQDADNVQDISIQFTHESADSYRYGDDLVKVEGKLKLRLVEKSLNPDLQKETEYLINEIKAQNYALGDLIERVDSFKLHQDITPLGIERYALPYLKKNRLDHELWFAILEGEDYYYFVTMSTPVQEKKYLQWAHNLAAFKKILETLAPL